MCIESPCSACPQHFSQGLSSLPGVSSSEVNVHRAGGCPKGLIPATGDNPQTFTRHQRALMKGFLQHRLHWRAAAAQPRLPEQHEERSIKEQTRKLNPLNPERGE